jgi:hypothetical protein
MAMGYHGWARIGDVYGLVQSASAPQTRNPLVSSSGYGGKIDDAAARGIASPYNYDLDSYDGNLEFEASLRFLKDAILPWINERQEPRDVEFATRWLNRQKHPLSFWNSITLAAGEGSIVTCSVAFISYFRETYAYGEWGNGSREGAELLCGGSDFPEPLNELRNLSPIPHWNTRVLYDGSMVEFVDWTLTLTQTVDKFFTCEGKPAAQPPKYVAAGPLTVSFNGSYIAARPDPEKEEGIELVVEIGVSDTSPMKFTLSRGDIQTENDDLQGPDALAVRSLDIQFYKLEVE